MLGNLQYIETISYGVGALATFLLLLLLLTGWAKHSKGSFLILATLLTTLWLFSAAIHAYALAPGLAVVNSLEVLRSGAWYLFIFSILGLHSTSISRFSRIITLLCYSLFVVTLLVTLTPNSLFIELISFTGQTSLIITTHLFVAVAGLFLVEQLYRNAAPSQRWALKYLCLGLALMFAYDVYLYSEAMLFNAINPVAWNVRGVLFIIITPLLAVSAARNPVWKLDVFVSRDAAFHTATLMITGVYLLFMSAAGYYIQLYGGSWGSIAQRAFIILALVFLVIILMSGQFRARLKVILSKHFYNYKYDYRNEWLRFNRTLSLTDARSSYQQKAIKAIAEILESPGGYLFKHDGSDHFTPVERLNAEQVNISIDSDTPLIDLMQNKRWIVNLDEKSVSGLADAWLAIPLFQENELYGVVVVLHSRAPSILNWEDFDLLKTVADGVVNYLVQGDNALALMEARQFEAFHRLSAFVVHDLKNVSAQLSLIVKNSKRHRDKPEFVDDAFSTVDNAVARMNRMLAHLRQKTQVSHAQSYERLTSMLRNATQLCADRLPMPLLEQDENSQAKVQVNIEKFTDVMVHLIHNAQDATADTGSVKVRLSVTHKSAIIEVIDTGTGMDEAFIQQRLFKPFDTTKGNAGMGIGAYEARDYIESIAGRIEVASKPGSGTTFMITLPLVSEKGQKQDNFEAIR